MRQSLRKKVKRLKEILKGYQKVILTLSGGVDSTLLLRFALKTLGKENVLAVTFVSPIYAQDELKAVKKIIRILGAEHLFIPTEELKDKNFRKNSLERCYFCKQNAYLHLKRVIKETDFRDGVIIEGTNASDLNDYRPGRRALKELNIKSPFFLAGITKEEIRVLAKNFSLPNYRKPSSPCLASRIPFFQEITESLLERVEKGEAVLKKAGLKFSRLRSEGDIARIEVLKDWAKVIRKREEIIKGIKGLGYRYVTLDLEGYRPMGLQWKRK